MAPPKKDYAAIAKSRIHRPRNETREPRLLCYGKQKKGKTTFGISAGTETTLVLDPESGTTEMKTKNPHVWPIDKWEDVSDAYEFLRMGEHRYEWVVVDSLTRLNNMALKYVMKLQEERSLDRIPGLVQRQDYGKSGELMKDMIVRFHNMRTMGIIFTAQERMVEASDSDDEDDDADGSEAAYVPDLPKSVKNMVNSVVDVIGRIYVVRIEDPNDSEKTMAQRRLWIGESTKYDTGYRSDHKLPDMVKNPTVPKLIRLIRTGKATVARATA